MIDKFETSGPRRNGPFFETARAKVNLTLHVGQIIQDPDHRFYNYHPLDSLVVFSNIADTLQATLREGEPSNNVSNPTLGISGPFYSKLLENDPSNLIIQAYNAVAHEAPLPAIDFHLEKNLPIASGLGGGSANAAAVLRILKKITHLPEQKWEEIALKLGADVPVCMDQKTAFMRGIGEIVEPIADMGRVHGVLVNPGVGVSTGEIFRQFDRANPLAAPKPQKLNGNLIQRAIDGRNDLEPVTQKLLPEVEDTLRELRRTSFCKLARMSGSGATCFGLYETEDHARLATHRIRKSQPSWWCEYSEFGTEGS